MGPLFFFSYFFFLPFLVFFLAFYFFIFSHFLFISSFFDFLMFFIFFFHFFRRKSFFFSFFCISFKYFFLLALVSEFNCFLRSRCSMEMWCPDDIGRDSWDWVGPPAWGRACFNSPESGGGSSPVKTEPPQIVLLLSLLFLTLSFTVVAQHPGVQLPASAPPPGPRQQTVKTICRQGHPKIQNTNKMLENIAFSTTCEHRSNSCPKRVAIASVRVMASSVHHSRAKTVQRSISRSQTSFR